jgi:hypothetical protein
LGLIFDAVASRAAVTIASVIGVAATRIYLLIVDMLYIALIAAKA